MQQKKLKPPQKQLNQSVRQALTGICSTLYFTKNRKITQMNNIIDVSYPTHGLQAGAQVHYNPSCHTWTVCLANGLERTLYSLKSYCNFMNGVAEIIATRKSEVIE